MKSKVKKYILYILLIIASILGIAKISQAATYQINYRNVQSLMNDGAKAIGKTLGTVGRGNYGISNNFNVFSTNNNNIYCIQNHQYLGERSIYKVAKYIEINGKTATIVGPKYTKKTTNTENAKLAYVLGGGNYAKGFGSSEANTTARQNQVWAYWNTWAGKNLNGYTSSSNNTDRRTSDFYKITKEAAEYANSLDNSKSGEAYIKSVNKEVQSVETSDNKAFIGPIKLNFAGTLSLDNNNGFEFYNSNKQKMQNGIKDVKSEQAFYIKNTTKNTVSKLKFNVSASLQGLINAKIWIIKNIGVRQRLIIADTNTNPTKTSDSIEITVKPQKVGNLEIIKEDSKTKEKLAGAEFRISVGKDGDKNKAIWLHLNENGTYSYTAQWGNATNFKTDSKGAVQIKGLAKGKYYIYEVTAPTGYNKSKQDKYDSKNDWVACGSTNVGSENVTKVTINNALTGNLEITKEDSKTKEKLAGAEFRISVGENGDKNKAIWLHVNENGTYSYTAQWGNATNFKTDSKGEVEIKDLVKGKYYIYEVTAPTGYKKSQQKGYDSKNDWVACGVTDVESEKVTKVDIVNEPINTGDIEITKKDSKTAQKLAGAVFRISVGENGNKDKAIWLHVNENGTYSYTAQWGNATNFTTDSNGEVKLQGLAEGKYNIYEVTAPTGYNKSQQDGYDSKNDWVACGVTDVDSGKATKVDLKNIKTVDIEITKKDTTTKEKLTGAGFKVSVKEAGNRDKNIWLKQNGDKTYSYTSNFKDATEFKVTDANNGVYKIEGLNGSQKYFIYEVTAPKGYNLKAQDKYDSKNDWVECGSTDGESGNVVKVDIGNTKYINLEGYVWVETPGSKANEYNDLFDNSEEKITDKVNITLRNKSDNSEIAKASIDNSRKVYRFEKLDYNKLKDYYVNFDYSNTNYKSYITVEAKFDVANGSKALADNVPDYDKDLTGVATTYKGTADEAKYGLSYLATKFYNENTYTVENVNLGIKGLPETPFTVSENLAYVDMKIKGYNYRYTYGGTGQKVQTVPTVQWQSKTDKESYTRDIYPSDVLYENPSDKTQELQVYVTYRIDVTNNTKIDVPYLYQEKYLNVTKVSNKYDTARYELADSNWETGENSMVQMKNEYLQRQYYDANKNGISNEDEKNNKYAYITLKIKKEALTEMLKSKFGTIEEFPTEATVTAYHTYTRIDESWKNNITKTQTHYTRESTQSDKAPYLNTRPGENRTISGKVFEDKNARNNGELVGNGIYDQNENKVQGVTVELGNYNDDGTFVVTDLYAKNEDGTTKFATDGKLPKATMKTTEKEGTYSFEGVVPGEYFLRYTYGDGTQEIVATDGNKKVSSDQYKSTIVTEEIKKAYETNYEATKATWYLGMGENHNIAVDDLTLRADLSKDKYVLDITNAGAKEAKNIIASTPEFSVPIEFTDKTEGAATEQYPADLGYMDFGIIEMPNTRVGINKKITNIKLTYQNGQVAIDGNPATQNLAYTTDLDKKTNGGSKYVKVELDSEYIYGGTLEIKYEIEISNDSDIDYIEKEGSNTYGYYYKYGEITKDAHEKTLKIEDAIDYLDPKLSYKSKEGELDIKEVDVQEFRNKEASALTAEQKRILALIKAQEELSGKEFSKVLQIAGIGELNTSKGANKDKSSKTITINAEKLLSSQEDDLEFINVVEVTKIEVEPITPANVEFTSSNATQKIAMTPNVTITITPSTGENRSLVYLVTGTIALAIVAGGIAIIKKKSRK